MFNFNDVKTVLDQTPIEKLAQSYTARQKYNKKINNDVAKEVVDELSFEPENIPGEYAGKLQIHISALITSGKTDAYEIAKRILNAFKYQKKQEIIVACQYIDSLTTDDITLDLFNYIINGLLSIDSLTKIDSSRYKLATEFGEIKIANACQTLDIEQIPPENRRGLCHNITTSFLIEHPDFYGAYHYLPQSFKGFLEHSIVIDPDSNIAYDLANNTAMNLKVWQSLFSYAFIISGKNLKEIYFKTLEAYNHDIQLALLEEVRIRTKK